MTFEIDETTIRNNGFVKASDYSHTLLSLRKVAQICKVATSRVSNYVKDGYIPTVITDDGKVKVALSVALVLDFPAMKKEYLSRRPPVERNRKMRNKRERR